MAEKKADIIAKYKKLLQVMQGMKKTGDVLADYLERRTKDDTPLFSEPIHKEIMRWRELEDILFEEVNND
jgi:hypothetical protein